MNALRLRTLGMRDRNAGSRPFYCSGALLRPRPALAGEGKTVSPRSCCG